MVRRDYVKRISVALLIFAAVASWYGAAHAPMSALTVSFLDVGQGDAILIQGPTGNQVLIDAGKDRRVLSELSRVMPFHDRSIDLVVATHPDLDHIGGMPYVFDSYEIGSFLESGLVTDKAADAALHERVASEGSASAVATRGMTFDMGGGATFEVLSPEGSVLGLETNDASVVAIVTYGTTRFLLTGDASEIVERRLVAEYGGSLKSDVLKAGHHGSKTSTSQAFLDAVSPAYAVISAGKGNRYGHPHAEVMDRLAALGAILGKTYESGSITFVSDGMTLEMRD